jgi:ABC-type phosphate/phosphonate transport system substrate-binding protein
VFPRIDLLAHGVTFASESFHDTAAGAFAAVSAGEADVCAAFVGSATVDAVLGAAEVLRLYGERVADLRVLHVTDLIPPDGIALSAGAAADESAVRAALLSLHETAEGAAAVKGLLQAERLVGVADPLKRMLRSWTELALSRAEPTPVSVSPVR